MTREEAIFCLKIGGCEDCRYYDGEECTGNYSSEAEKRGSDNIAKEMAIRSLEAWGKVIEEMQSKRATFPTPKKESWYKEVIARNSGIDECIDIINKHLQEVNGEK